MPHEQRSIDAITWETRYEGLVREIIGWIGVCERRETALMRDPWDDPQALRDNKIRLEILRDLLGQARRWEHAIEESAPTASEDPA